MKFTVVLTFSLAMIALLAISVTGCSPATTVTVAGPTATVTITSQAPAVTHTVTTTATTTITATTTVTATVTVTPTPSPTQARNPYQGAVAGSWSGTESVNPPSVSGTFAVTVDASGSIHGSFYGTFSGTITGQIDTNGNLTATGLASLNGISIQTTWQGKFTASGNALSGQGTWSDAYGSGTFTGTGTSLQ